MFAGPDLVLQDQKSDSRKSERNHCTSQRPKWRGDKEGSYSLRCVRKTPEKYSRKNLYSWVETENPIHIVPPLALFKPGS